VRPLVIGTWTKLLSSWPGAPLPDRLRDARQPHATHAVTQSLVVAEKESLVANNGTTESSAELVPKTEWFRGVGLVREKAVGVENLVAMKLVGGSVECVRTALDYGVDQSARAATELGCVGIGLNLELLQCVDGWLYHLHVVSAERIRVRRVVDSIKQKCVLERAIPVDIECAFETEPTSIVMSSRLVEFTWSVMPEFTNFLKPVSVAVTVYTPGRRLGTK
jgi:hypothetical protein